VAEPDLTAHLDVYDTRDGPWNPEHGDLEIPEDWEFLPAGDAFVTRQVKAAGAYWTAWSPAAETDRTVGVWGYGHRRRPSRLLAGPRQRRSKPAC
jgi:hypothetical protein